MKKELISAFVDSELDEKESEQLQNENRNELKELVNIYRVIGESIQYCQSKIQLSEQFQVRLKEVLKQEYSAFSIQSAAESNSHPAEYVESAPVNEESVI